MDVLRTPDHRFDSLPGYPWEPHYLDVPAGDGGTLRVHYLDEGPADAAEVLLLLHGEPSWSYLYRHMIPPFVAAGHRVVAPDLVGFGRSDKPADRRDYTYQRHLDWLDAALLGPGGLQLDDITLVCQDWGGLLGLRLVGEQPERFRRVVAANTFLPTGEGRPSEAFFRWQRFSQEVEEFPTGFIIGTGTTTELPPEVVAAYDAPFPDESYKEGARQFPLLVPTDPDDPGAAGNRRAWEVLERFEAPFLCAFSDQDPVTAGNDRPFRRRVPGAVGREHVVIEGAGHFLQEDRGPELAAAVLAFVSSTPA